MIVFNGRQEWSEMNKNLYWCYCRFNFISIEVRLPNARLTNYQLSLYFFFFSCFFFKGHTYGIWRFPGYGSNQSYSCWPTPEPQQCQIWATSVMYTTAHSSAVSLTHWGRPGIKPTTTWFLVGFVSAVPQRELQSLHFIKRLFQIVLHLEFPLWLSGNKPN